MWPPPFISLRRTEKMRPALAILAATMLVLSVGCGAPTEHADSAPVTEPPPYEWVPIEDISIRWTAVPGVDLDSPEVLVARAFGDSELFYEITGQYESAYEGFPEAAPYLDNGGRTYPRTGTVNNHVFEVRPLPDRFKRPSYRVAYCTDETDTAIPTGDAWKANGASNRYTYILAITRTGWNTPVPRVDRAVRTRHPSWNVFEGWEVRLRTRWENDFFSGHDPEDRALLDYCDDEHPPSNGNFRYGDILDAPPVVQPSVPGWPQRVDGP